MGRATKGGDGVDRGRGAVHCFTQLMATYEKQPFTPNVDAARCPFFAIDSNQPFISLAQTNVRLSQLVMNNQKSSSHLELFRAIAFGIRRRARGKVEGAVRG